MQAVPESGSFLGVSLGTSRTQNEDSFLSASLGLGECFLILALLFAIFHCLLLYGFACPDDGFSSFHNGFCLNLFLHLIFSVAYLLILFKVVTFWNQVIFLGSE